MCTVLLVPIPNLSSIPIPGPVQCVFRITLMQKETVVYISLQTV